MAAAQFSNNMPDTPTPWDQIDPTLNPHMRVGPTISPASVPTSITAEQVPALVRAAAAKHGVDPDLALGVARTESSMNPNTTFGPEIKGTKDRAYGLFQLMPKTAQDLGVDRTDIYQNIEGGVRYLRQLLDKNKGDKAAALKEYGGFRTADPSEYIANVMNRHPATAYQPQGVPTTWDKIESGFNPPATEGAGPQLKGPMGFWEQFQNVMNNLGPGISEHVRRNPEFYGNLAATVLAPELGVPAKIAEAGGFPAFAARLGNATLRTGLGVAGAVGGNVAERALEGQSTTGQDLTNIVKEQGPLAAISMALELPGVFKPAQKFSEDVYKSTFRPTPKEMKKGVLGTLQDEGVIPNSNAPHSLAARHDEVNRLIDQEMSKQKPIPGIVPLGQAGAQANTSILNPKLVQDFKDWVSQNATGKAFKDRWNSQANEIITEWQKDHPQDWIDFNNARELKTDMRREANLQYGEKGSYKDQLYKQFSKMIDGKMEEINPRLKPLHERLGRIIDAEPAVERFAARAANPMLSYNLAKYGIMGATGATVGLYGVHQPWTGLGLGLAAGALSNPANFARLSLFMKNNPELARTMFGVGPKAVVTNPAFSEQRREGGSIPQAAMQSTINLAESPFVNQ